MKREWEEGGIYSGETGMPRDCVFWPTGGVRVGHLMFGRIFQRWYFAFLPSSMIAVGEMAERKKEGRGGNNRSLK